MLLLYVFLLSCKPKDKTLEYQNYSLITTQIALDSLKFALLENGIERKFLKIKHYNEISLAKEYQIDFSKNDWICDLLNQNTEKLISVQYLKFQEESINEIISEKKIGDISSLDSLFRKLSGNMLLITNDKGKKEFYQQRMAFDTCTENCNLVYCRKNDLVKLFNDLSSNKTEKNKLIYIRPQSSYMTDSNKLNNCPYFELSFNMMKKKVELKYLFNSNIIYT